MRRSSPPKFGFSSVSAEDPYADLLSRTRDLRHEQRHARDVWFQQLALDNRAETLFELEVLLKASACFSNPRNHPGPHHRTPVSARDFAGATALFGEGLRSVMELSHSLLEANERAYAFHRYLETVLPSDDLRPSPTREGTEQASPEQSLLTLRHGLTTAIELVDGVGRSERVPFRLFYALLSTVQREVRRNEFFNPLSALEFRPEFDRIKSPQILELIRSVPGREAHRLVVLTFLSLFRLLRYLKILERSAEESVAPIRRAATSYLVLSVLRSDGRALTEYIHANSGQLLAEGFERDLLRVPAGEIRSRTRSLRVAGEASVATREALEGVAESLRLELRRTFRHDLPPVDVADADEPFRASLQGAIASLRPAIRRSILFLAKALGCTLDELVAFDDEGAIREGALRTRRDSWMFAQILRAFATKAQHALPSDPWTISPHAKYVREFLAYHRAMGRSLLESARYPRREPLAAALHALEHSDLVDTARLARAADECLGFRDFLLESVQELSKSEVLFGLPFNRRAAATALSEYLRD